MYSFLLITFFSNILCQRTDIQGSRGISGVKLEHLHMQMYAITHRLILLDSLQHFDEEFVSIDEWAKRETKVMSEPPIMKCGPSESIIRGAHAQISYLAMKYNLFPSSRLMLIRTFEIGDLSNILKTRIRLMLELLCEHPKAKDVIHKRIASSIESYINWLELIITNDTGYAFGNSPTLADYYLISDFIMFEAIVQELGMDSTFLDELLQRNTPIAKIAVASKKYTVVQTYNKIYGHLPMIPNVILDRLRQAESAPPKPLQ